MLLRFARNYYQDPTVIGNPYQYGYVPEVSIDEKGQATAVKHYSMGRLSIENVKVAPDNRTVYFGDDGSYTMAFMYIADKAKIYQQVLYMQQNGFKQVKKMVDLRS